MYIKKWTSPSLVLIEADTTCAQALEIMNKEKIRRIPVVEDGKLLGLVTLRKILALKEDPATVPAKDVMYTDLITITPDTTVMETLIIGQQNKIGVFPVVEGDKLVGLITEVELFQALHQLLGLDESSTFLGLSDLKVEEGTFGQVVSAIEGSEGAVKSIFTLPQPSSDLSRILVRFQGGNLRTILYNLKSVGFKVDEHITVKGFKIT